MMSDNEDDENENYQADDDDDYDYEGVESYGNENETREGAVDNVEESAPADYVADDDVSESGSVSFDERAEWNCDQRSSSSSLDRVYDPEVSGDRPETRLWGGGHQREEKDAGDKSSVSMDKISTMTLSEFKSLLNSNLSVPENQATDNQCGRGVGGVGSARSPGSFSDSSQHQANWDSLREKARSVRDSISNSVTNRRAGATTTTVGRRSLPQSPDSSGAPPSFERPKTPQALRRNKNPASGRSSPVSRPKTPTSAPAPRPKTPTSSIARPKTPTSGISRPKTPTYAPKEEYRMSRPKTPSQVKRDAVAKVAGAISNWVDSRPDMATFDRQRSSSRPKTPTRQQATQRWDGDTDGDADIDDDLDDDGDNSEMCDIQSRRAVPAAAKDRPSTPSRIPKPSFLPRPTTPKHSSAAGSFDSDASFSRERPHTSLGTSSSLSLTSQEQEIIQRQQQLQRLQQELEEAQMRADEERRKQSQQPQQHTQVQEQYQNQQQGQQPHAARPNFLPTNSVSRSNSNASSDVVQSPSASVNGFGPKTKLTMSRKLPLPRGSSEDSSSSSRNYRQIHTARRCVTPGPSGGEFRVQPSRAVTPGPREKWTLGGNAGSNKVSQQRRGSLNNGAATDRHSNNTNVSSNQMTNGQMTFTNEITFSDDEEINELVRNGALVSNT
ncbi:hypothetical protein EGW08_006371, partial [Elysia chlorotica]